MSKILSNILLIMLFLAPSCLLGMDSKKRQSEAGQEIHGKRMCLAATVKLLSKDEAEFTIALDTANQSETLKNMIEDLGEQAKLPIPLPEISGLQLKLLLPVMQKLAELPMAELKANEEKKLARQLQQIVADLKSNEQPLNNQQLIEFITDANYLDIPLVKPALQTLAHRILNKDDWTQLESLGDKLKDLWQVHPAKKVMLEGLSLEHSDVSGVVKSSDGKKFISWGGTIEIWDKNNLAAQSIALEHPRVKGVIESIDGKNLISWSWGDGIKVWDKNKLAAESIALKHLGVVGVIESLDGKNLISWSWAEGTIKVWDKTNFAAEPITLEHEEIDGVIESSDGKNLISWSENKDTIKIWDMALLDPTSEQIHLLLAVYFVSEGNQKFELPAAKLSKLKATFNMLSSINQAFLERQAPDFVAVIKPAQE